MRQKRHHDKFAIAGGVASNRTLRAAMETACERTAYAFYRPSPIFCTDNAAMIGVAAYYEYRQGTSHGWDLNAVPNLKLGRTIMENDRSRKRSLQQLSWQQEGKEDAAA